jgi:hypothetical protein
MGDPYTLQEDTELTEYNPKIFLKAGELVCSAKYLEKVPRAKQWYTQTREAIMTTVQMQQVVAADSKLMPISPDNQLPRTCRRQHAQELGAVRVSDEDHDEIMEEIHRREILDFDEEDDASSSSERETGDDDDDET